MPDRSSHEIDLKPRQVDYLQKIMSEYDLPDEGKVIRVLIDYAMSEPGVEEQIFGETRCMDC